MPKKPTKPSDRVLVIRTCAANMASHHDPKFIWPREGFCEAPDWDPSPEIECGNGLHGLLWGNGDWSLLSSAVDAVWMIVSVDPADGLVVGTSKCRFKRGEVIYCGDQAGATTRILCAPEAMARAQAEAKKANKSSGHGSTAASSGHGSTAASSGNHSKAASSGDYSKAASSGYGIAMVAGNNGQAKAGENGLIVLSWWDEPAKRYRACVGEVGIAGVKADTWYKVVAGQLVEA